MASSKYIVRLPIKDAASQIVGYEILYHGENEAYGGDAAGSGGRPNEFAVADTIYNFLTQNTDKVLKGSLNFMTFTTTLLMKRVPSLFEKSDLVIQIDDSVLIHPLAMRFVRQFAKEGYQIAINDFQFAPRYLSLLDDIDYVKLNVQDMSDVTMHNVVEVAHSMGKKCIAMGIENEELYAKALELGVDALEGGYVAAKMATKAHTSGYLQSNFFRLMVAVTRDEPDLEEIEQIIGMDATLSYGLLKMSNSVHFAVRNRVTTIRQAIMTLGIAQLKQWVYLLSASNAENEIDPDSEEFLRLSFMRANFCSELMAYTKVVPLSKGEAYLMGMFSTLNYLIDAPMEDILAEIPVADDIKIALLRHEGPCGALYDLALSYERADWNEVNRLAEVLGIQTNLLTSLYFNCMDTTNELWQDIISVEENGTPAAAEPVEKKEAAGEAAPEEQQGPEEKAEPEEKPKKRSRTAKKAKEPDPAAQEAPAEEETPAKEAAAKKTPAKEAEPVEDQEKAKPKARTRTRKSKAKESEES